MWSRFTGSSLGGTYKGEVYTNGIISIGEPCEITHQRAGILMLPGDGRILFDAVDMDLEI